MQIIPRTDVPNTYLVQSGEKTYNVDLRDPYTPTCDCDGWCWTEQICKHIVFARHWQDGEP